MVTMADPANSRSAGRASDGPGTRTGAETWVRRIVVSLVLVVLAFVVYGLLAAALPRWWAQRVGDQVDGRMTVGVFWGLFYGFVFTFVPVLVAWQVRRPFLKWPWKIAVVVVALALAAPNWLTLSISLGDNSASDAGWQTMVVRAPGFQWATFFGALAGVIAAMALVLLAAAARRRKHEVSDLKGQMAERDANERAGTAQPNELHREEPPHA
jgi:NhaP-type Na+/H+ or K+/H+ antiporter